MTKVLISLLGTGKQAKGDFSKNEYLTTDYVVKGKTYPQKKFSAAALIEHFGIERVHFVGTASSMWDALAERFGDDDEYTLELIEKKEKEAITQKDLGNLEAMIDATLESSGSRCHIVQEGENDEELWTIAEKFISIMKSLHPSDEVYLDITHLFRSVAVMSVVMAELGKVLHDLRFVGIYYAMLKHGEPSTIVDLTLFFELLDWARAIRSLKHYGNAYEILDLVERTEESKEIKNTFADFANALGMSNMAALQRSVKVLKGKLALFEQSSHRLVPFVAKELRDFVEYFHIEDLAVFQFELARWYAENRNYAMAYITLAEAAVTALCEREGIDPVGKENRERAKALFYEMGDWKTSDKSSQKIAKTFHMVNAIRNGIAHKLPPEAMKKNSSPKDSVANIANYIDTLSKLLKK
ncbi:TIGR02221 family CRISPR-associated protein [Hydrogenimonas cancrithermarum]|uniref:TIGR02221 family CRISPR-associated protein n=1 Tax=Hydrogenimonas cancrithermarum TaxID=2993563 RepID=A0ABN6WUY2_9BACT|nr:TIGR02221 family CRISPR-associated protein [Hydrogenimonas cancrithermarum]BDY11962.1 hypothetical protein HCR_02740 [Hydrogenimonas cancrithermarum]